MSALAAGTLPASAQAGEHRWGGLLSDAFTRETAQGLEAWTTEDGGRIRHRDPATGAWSFQAVPDEVKDTLRRVFFLPGTDTGWAVGQGGWVLKTVNGGTTWSTLGTRITAQGPGEDPHEDLFDIHFVDGNEGYMVGLHSIWSTANGGASWTLYGSPYNPATNEFYNLTLAHVELYAIDIVERPDGSRLGLISGQPGIVIRATGTPSAPELVSWEVAWEITELCAATPCGGPTSQLSSCACDICPGGPDHPGPWFEAWDIEISNHVTQPLALLGGGVGSQCGMIFASTDDGDSWNAEFHECTCPTGPACIDCSALPLYNDDPNDPFDLNRLKHFRTLYGLGIFDGDNSAVAAGYNRQHLVRDPATGVWQDRSVFAVGLPTVQNSVIFPLFGAEALTLNSGGKAAVISGTGGHLRESYDGGHSWTDRAVGEPHRIANVFFKDTGTGWHVGQFFRIAKTITGGVTWEEQWPQSSTSSQGFFRAVAFAPTLDMNGVAVGDSYVPAGANDSVPKIRYTDADIQTVVNAQWAEDVQVLGDATFMNGKRLEDVAWSGAAEFWAVGSGGLILASTNGGKTWRMKLPEIAATLSQFQMEGVDFRDTTTGIMVGRRTVSGQPAVGEARQYKIVGTTVSWTNLELPAGMSVVALWDVSISGSTAWIVGERVVNGVVEGVVLRSPWSSGSFGDLTDATPASGVPPCNTGGSVVGVPVLSEVEVAPVTGEVWIGGACGRLWVRSTSGVWSEVKSATDTHVLGMSFVPDGGSARGFIGGFRATNTQHCIISVQ